MSVQTRVKLRQQEGVVDDSTSLTLNSSDTFARGFFVFLLIQLFGWSVYKLFTHGKMDV